MAIYNASLLISASNATYFTNVTGGIAAVAVRDFNDTWISSSALLTGSNTFVGNQIISGNVDINGAFSASLQTGYLYVGNGNGRTQAVATSSIITNIETGSFATTGSNTFIGNQIISGNVLPLVDGQGDLGTDTYKWNQVVVNGQLKGSSLNTTGRGAVGTLRVGDETFPLSFLSDREIVGDGTGANTHLYYGTSSADVTALREFVYTQSGSNADFGNVSASFNTRIDNLSGITGSFATTGSNVFKGTQFLYSTDGAAPLQISSSAYYGIQLQNQGIQITGNGGPRIQFPNHAWLNGNENDAFQFTADTNDPVTRGIDFYLYGSGSRIMRFRNDSGPGGTIQFSTSQSAITFTAGDNIGLTAGNQLSLTGSQTNINGLRYPNSDGTNGQALITNGSGILSFGNVSINTGSFATTGSNTFTGNQTISTAGNTQLNLVAQPGFQTNIDFQSENSNFRAYGDFRINNNGDAGGSGSIKMLTKNNFIEYAADQGFRFGVVNAGGNGIEGGFVTINVPSGSQQLQLTGSLVVQNTLTASLQEGYAWVGGTGNISTLVATSSFGSGGATGSFATLGANLFTGSQTIQSGSKILFNGTGTGGDANGLDFGSGNATLYYTAGGTNFLQFVGTNAGIDFSTAGSNNNLNFRTTGTNGQIQFTSNSSSISLTSATTTTISSSTTNIYSPSSVGGGINNRGVVTIGQNIGTGFGESYLLGYSGSLVLGNSVNSATYAALSHITSSQPNGNNGLIFKNNNNTGATLLNGGANIFTNPNTPTTDYIRYIGGSNNLFLNNLNGVNVQITSSAASVSGNRPTMHNNIFNGTSNFNINLPAVNPGSHNYNNNIFNAGALTINGMAFTGSLTLGSNINAFGTININAASASFADIASGLSGSHTINVNSNGIFGGIINLTTNRNQPSNINQNITNNVLAGASINITNHSSSLAVSVQSNIANGTMTYSNVGAAGLALHRSAGSMNANYGAMNLIASASSISSLGNTSPASMAVVNRHYSGSLGSGSLTYNNNAVFGVNNTYTISGSYGGTAAGASMNSNGIFGLSNTFFTNVEGRGNYVGFSSNIVGGSNLILTGSNNVVLQEQGGAHIGRWNANDGLRNTTGENIFSVGTGVSGSRKTGFLIDSGSNSFFEGSLNVSGSTSMTGSLLVTSFTTLASVSSSLDFADDTAAAAGGVPLGGLYRNGNFVMIRLT
jgi:hypothetical protein